MLALLLTAVPAAGALVALVAVAVASAPAATAAPGDPAPGGAPPSSAPTAGSTPAAGAAPVRPVTPIQVDLVAVSPPTPTAAALEQPVSITVVLTNVGDATYSRVRVGLDRGAAIVQRVLLHEAIASAPATDQFSANQEPVLAPGPLAPGASASVTYVTTPEAMGMFVNGVYPYDLVAEGTIGGGPFRELGRASLLVPSLYTPPAAPLSISWLWPLIDVPHVAPEDLLATGGATFRNDDLAASVRSGGRLDRALQVVEAVTPAVRMTLVIDPQLINELLLMGEGYDVASGAGTVAGGGSEAARTWLARLKAVAGSHDLVLTGLGDPDLDSIAAAGLPRGGQLSAALAQRISTALGAPYRTDLIWPVAETLTQAAADAVLSSGVAGSVLLRDTALSGGTRPDTSASAGGMPGEVRGLSDSTLSPLTISGSTTAAGAAVVLDSSLRRRVIQATEASQIRTAGTVSQLAPPADTATAATRIQALVAELAMWPLAGAAAGGYVALAPDRDVDADATAAAAAILATAAAGWARVEPLREAVQTAARIPRGALPEAMSAPGLDTAVISAVQDADRRLSAAEDLLGAESLASLAPARAALVAATSAGWRDDPDPALAYAFFAASAAQDIVGGVSVVTPDNASYSLSSENSPLIITVRNDLEFPVSVRLAVSPATAAASGFRADDIGVQVIEAGTARTLQVPAHFERSGRFEVVAQLATESGVPLGEPVRLSVLCTAYGTVALTITIAAFALLLLLLLFRGVRGLRRAHLARAAARA